MIYMYHILSAWNSPIQANQAKKTLPGLADNFKGNHEDENIRLIGVVVS